LCPSNDRHGCCAYGSGSDCGNSACHSGATRCDRASTCSGQPTRDRSGGAGTNGGRRSRPCGSGSHAHTDASTNACTSDPANACHNCFIILNRHLGTSVCVLEHDRSAKIVFQGLNETWRRVIKSLFSFLTFPTALPTGYHSNASTGSPWWAIISSASSVASSGSSQLAAHSGDSTTGLRSCISTMPWSLSAVMITNPSPSRGSLPSRLNCPIPAKYIGAPSFLWM